MSWLISMSGPPLEPIELDAAAAGEDGLIVGRHEASHIRLPPDAEQVSRQHAKFRFDGEHWRLQDLGSRWGTFVSGVRLQPKTEMPIRDGDLIRIAPWTFTLSPTPKKRGLALKEDTGQTIVRAVNDKTVQPLADNLLHLLLESTSRIHGSTSEQELADNVIDAAVRGTGLSNAVVLKPVDGLKSFEIIATKLSPQAKDAPAYYSRSLINTAAGGQVAEIGAGSGGDFSQSLVQMNVSAAICVPLMLGASAAAFLYLDSRGSALQSLRPNAAAFCVALSRMASLALSNLKRVEIEKRQTQMNAELNAAAAAQRWIMPKREQQFGPLTTIGESKPGQYVGGDFFDIIPLTDGKLAISVGDVSGKGVSASVLMTATQGFLHAAITEHEDPGAAVTKLNRFVAPRRPSSRFVTLWAGVIDPQKGTIAYVDAAHSYAVLQRADGTVQQLSEGDGLPLGVMDEGVYTAIEVPFAPGDQLVVVSDGIIEQPAGQPTGDDRNQFEVDGVREVLAAKPDDPVKSLFEAVISHATSDQLADDATAVWVRFGE